MTFNRQYKLLEEKETESLEDLFVKLEGVTVGYKPEDEKENEKGDPEKETVDLEAEDSEAKEENKENENTEQMPNEPPSLQHPSS